MSGLTANCWILISVSTFHLLLYDFLLEVYEENLASNKHAIVKEISILIAFSNNYRYSMILHQKLNKWCFLEG